MSKRLYDFKWTVPHLGAFLIFLGVLKLHLYYSYFGIPITSFLEFSEILTSFFSFLVLIVCVTMGIVVYCVGMKIDILSPVPDAKKTNFMWLIWPIGILAFIYVSVPFIAYNFFNYQFSASGVMLAWIAVCSVGLLILLFLIILIYRGKIAIRREYQRLVFFSLVIVLAIGLIGIASNEEAYAVRYKGRYSSVKIIFKEGFELQSDDSSFYIGKTNKYLFFHEGRLRKTIVYSMDDIKSLEFRAANMKVID